jgi:hypothetical protein
LRVARLAKCFVNRDRRAAVIALRLLTIPCGAALLPANIPHITSRNEAIHDEDH